MLFGRVARRHFRLHHVTMGPAYGWRRSAVFDAVLVLGIQPEGKSCNRRESEQTLLAPTSTMAARSFTLQTDFTQPVAEVFGSLSRHETLARVFGIPIRTVQPSPDGELPGGVGSVRSISLGPLRFEETVTGFERDRMITYRVTKGGFLRHHDARMHFTSKPGGAGGGSKSGTRVEHWVEMESAIPGVTHILVPLVGFIMRRAFLRYARRSQL